MAKDMDMHVHCFGRTGRAGEKDGTAYTLITQKEARFAGELVNSLIAAGQNVSPELMDLAMKDGWFRSKRDARKGGGGKRAKGRGGSGRGVRGVDFGLGIGYNAESKAESNPTPSRSASVNSLRTGMMTQFRSNFVAASSNSQNQFVQGSSGTQPNKRMVLPGFVSGGTIGGEMSPVKVHTVPATTPAAHSTPNSGESRKQTHSERDKGRERRRPSGWDR